MPAALAGVNHELGTSGKSAITMSLFHFRLAPSINVEGYCRPEARHQRRSFRRLLIERRSIESRSRHRVSLVDAPNRYDGPVDGQQ